MKKIRDFFKKYLKFVIMISVSLCVTIVFTVLTTTVDSKLVLGLGIMIPIWCGILEWILIENYIQYKKKIEERIPNFLIELYNNGVISKEQLENPTENEKAMFFGEYASALRTRKALMVIVPLIAIYGTLRFFL